MPRRKLGPKDHDMLLVLAALFVMTMKLPGAEKKPPAMRAGGELLLLEEGAFSEPPPDPMLHAAGIKVKTAVNERKDLAILALARSATITDLAIGRGVSRKFVYAQTQKARVALDDAFLPATGADDVLFELAVTKTWLRQVIVALPLIRHSSYRGVVEFMRDLLGISISLGTVHNELQAATRNAVIVNDAEELSSVRVGLHDEIFQGKTSVLAGVVLPAKR